MHLLRTHRYDGPWLQLMPDSSADCDALEVLAAAEVRTCGRGTIAEEARLRMILELTAASTIATEGRPAAAEGGTE
jgi:hypothetical protein